MASPQKTLQDIQFLDKYSRWNGFRRETWKETVERVTEYLRPFVPEGLLQDFYTAMQLVEQKDIMPSMRLIAMAGEAAKRDNTTIFNCSYLPIDSINAFVEVLQVSMAGCGVGYSVESKQVDKLPNVAIQSGVSSYYQVPDTQQGWANALHVGLLAWFSGEDVEFDFSRIRPAGTRLKTKGGIASGGEHLKQMLDSIRDIILSRQGSRLTTLDAHDIVCNISKSVVSGGVRRVATIALFDLDDTLMLNCKTPEAIKGNEQRWYANNSVVIKEEKDLDFWKWYVETMDSTKMGEPGLFSRYAIWKENIYKDVIDWGVNPCGEVILRPRQFCNLTNVVIRPSDSLQSLKVKARHATLLGIIQSLSEEFTVSLYNPDWKNNQIEDRLIGVCLTGMMDNPITQNLKTEEEKETLALISNAVFEWGYKYSKKFDIEVPARMTSVKPSGNSSVFLDTASGLHSRFAPYYIRRIRLNKNSPIAALLMDTPEMLPFIQPENGETWDNYNTLVVSFPIVSPKGSYTKRSAIEQLEYWKAVKEYYTDHNPSVTISYRTHELDEIAEWLFENQSIIGGLSFMNETDVVYEQMPYEEISEEEYLELLAKFPDVDLDRLDEYEQYDTTDVASEVACVSGYCEL